MLEVAVLIVFPALMAYAAASDLLTMTISNRVSIALVAVFLLVAILSGLGWQQVVLGHLACGFAVLALTYALFAFGQIGGGDAKLAAATAVWIGWDNLMDYGLEASIFGGLLTLSILALRRLPLPPALFRTPWIRRLHDAENGIPYGIALAAAALALYPQTSIWSSSA